MDQDLNRTQELLRRMSDSKAGKEVRRAALPWGLIIVAALAMGLAVSCIVSAFGG